MYYSDLQPRREVPLIKKGFFKRTILQVNHSNFDENVEQTEDRSAFSHPLSSEFRYHNNFESDFLDHKRDVIVYLPPDYDQQESWQYPVLYLHDGQNLFDSETAFNGVEWNVDETAERLINSDEIRPLIIVGIYNTGEHRIDEYTPTVDPKLKRGGKADLYGRFIVEELKPFIDRRYRTLPGSESTGLGGSSLGGLVSLYLGLREPHIFGKLMIMSPSVWWDRGMILRFVQSLQTKPSTSIWLDIGTEEGKLAPGHVRQLKDLLVARGWRLDADLKFLEEEGGQHIETAWGRRVEPALKFLFPK